MFIFAGKCSITRNCDFGKLRIRCQWFCGFPSSPHSCFRMHRDFPETISRDVSTRKFPVRNLSAVEIPEPCDDVDVWRCKRLNLTSWSFKLLLPRCDLLPCSLSTPVCWARSHLGWTWDDDRGARSHFDSTFGARVLLSILLDFEFRLWAPGIWLWATDSTPMQGLTFHFRIGLWPWLLTLILFHFHLIPDSPATSDLTLTLTIWFDPWLPKSIRQESSQIDF